MNDNLHHLLDGDLPDEASADLFRTLSESQGERQLFREQMKLQGALHRNECHGAMSPDEEAEMLARVGRDIGAAAPAAGRRFAPLAFLLLGIGLLVGGGTGYLVGGGAEVSQHSAVSPAPVYQAPVAEQPKEEVASPINRDSLVAAIRDSVVEAVNTTAAQNAAKKKGRISRKNTVLSDPTGREASKNQSKLKKQHPKVEN